MDSARGEDGQIELKVADEDLGVIVNSCCELFRSYSKDHSIEFKQPTSKVFSRVDEARVCQVVNNLISNAIKYSPFGGKVMVSITTVGAFAEIAIVDQGVGIEPEDIDGIFEPYRRAPTTKDAIPGVGLGLFTAKKIILAHGGEISVESAKGSGTCFKVRFPLSTRSSVLPFRKSSTLSVDSPSMH